MDLALLKVLEVRTIALKIRALMLAEASIYGINSTLGQISFFTSCFNLDII